MKKRMNTAKKASMAIAWDISYEIMSRSAEPLFLTVSHPGGEQHDCITVLNNADSDGGNLLINLCGESILANGELLRPYQELYEIDKPRLICDISRLCGYNLAPKAVRELPAMCFIKRLIDERYDDEMLCVTSAWYDGSYSSRLDTGAKDFPYYKQKESKHRRLHLPWWVISYSSKSLAMCNLETNKLITMHGNQYNLQDTTKREQAWIEIDKDIRFSDIDETAFETMRLTRANDEWVRRYREYARAITENLDCIEQLRGLFREWSPLKFYLNVTNAKNASSCLTLGVRYQGQEVAELIIKKAKSDTPLLNTKSKSKKYDTNNASYFGWNKSLIKVDWRGQEAKAFRDYFKKNPRRIENTAKHNDEHRIESLLLSEFLKHRTSDKALLYIQPVRIGGIRFPMPTPISASNHKAIKYSKSYGGGIDIFARVGKSGLSARLCVIELKDENNPKEPAIEVMKQAVAYATFVRELLRSESGSDWWKLFGFSKPIPKKLTLLAACAMPSGKNNDYSFANKEIQIENDVIRLHCIYFREADNKICSIESSLN